MQICTSPQTNNHAITPPLFFTGWDALTVKNEWWGAGVVVCLERDA